jgi:hypothetical protein
MSPANTYDETEALLASQEARIRAAEVRARSFVRKGGPRPSTPGRQCFAYCGDDQCTCEKNPRYRGGVFRSREEGLLPPNFAEHAARAIKLFGIPSPGGHWPAVQLTYDDNEGNPEPDLGYEHPGLGGPRR